MSFLSAFTTQLENLSIELNDILPKNKNVTNYNTAISILKKNNPRKLYTLFMVHVYIYKEQILEKSESFFLDNDYSGIAKKEKGIIFMNSLKQYWNILGDINKNNIWLYFQVLIKLCDKIDHQSKPNLFINV